jgi:hypothetical protein
VGLFLSVSQVRSEDKMATDLQMVTLLFYQLDPTSQVAWENWIALDMILAKKQGRKQYAS